MKKVEAEIRKERFEAVDAALRRIGVPGLTVTEEERAARGMWNYPLERIRHLLVTVVVDDEGAGKVVESIKESASTGSFGDGRISVTSVDSVLDIGSRGHDRSELLVPAFNN